MTGVLVRRSENTRGSSGGHVKEEAEMGGMQSQVKECPKSPKAGRNKVLLLRYCSVLGDESP